jgi:hypothetical protein
MSMICNKAIPELISIKHSPEPAFSRDYLAKARIRTDADILLQFYSNRKGEISNGIERSREDLIINQDGEQIEEFSEDENEEKVELMSEKADSSDAVIDEPDEYTMPLRAREALIQAAALGDHSDDGQHSNDTRHYSDVEYFDER